MMEIFAIEFEAESEKDRTEFIEAILDKGEGMGMAVSIGTIKVMGYPIRLERPKEDSI